MSKSISVALPNKEQKIIIGNGITHQVIDSLLDKGYSSFVIFGDSNFIHLYGDLFAEFKEKLNPVDVIFIEPNESSKSLDFLNYVLERCTTADLNRKGCLVVLGGGIVGDITGFLASVYMRGVDMVFIPTTLMAQGDTIVNKVAISYKILKNIVGSFYSPNITICDTNFLQSLSEKEISLGFSEIIKHALIDSEQFADYLLDELSQHSFNSKFDWEKIIYESIKIKSRIVEMDPYDENGIHKGLSYGHTFANALEGISNYNFRHGDAVAIGMRISGYISHKSGILSESDLEIQEKLLDMAKLPKFLPIRIDSNQIVSHLRRDKISSEGEISIVILKRIGEYKILHGVNEELVREALTKFQP